MPSQVCLLAPRHDSMNEKFAQNAGTLLSPWQGSVSSHCRHRSSAMHSKQRNRASSHAVPPSRRIAMRGSLPVRVITRSNRSA